MRGVVASLIFMLVSSLSAGTPKQIIRTTHVVQQETLLDASTCSATSIGEQALLLASHCELPSDSVLVDGIPAIVVERIRDGADHSIYLLKGVRFSDIAVVNQNELEQGDAVFILGHPAGLPSNFRHGYFSGVKPVPPIVLLLFDMNVYSGDSGASIFNDKGEVVAVVSVLNIERRDDGIGGFRQAAAFPMLFSAEELAKAKQWKTSSSTK